MKYKFGDIAINSTIKKKPEDSDRFHYIGLEHLDSGNLFVQRYGADVAPVGEKLVMKKGDILFGKRRAYQKKVAIAPFDGIFSAHGMVLRPNKTVVHKEYLPFFISSDYFLNEAIRISVGSLSPTINWRDLKELEFDLPPIEEQERLAELLWAAYDLKESYKKLIAATDEMVKAQFIEMFDKSHIPDIEIGATFKTISGGTPNSKISLYYENGTIPWLNSSDVEGYIKNIGTKITQQGLEHSSAKIVPANTVVVAMYGATVGKVGILQISAATNQAVCSILPNNDFLPEYVYYAIALQKNYMLNNAIGAAQPNISQSFIRKMRIKQPSIAAQKTFVSIAKQADKSKSELQQSIEHIDKVMKSLLP